MSLNLLASRIICLALAGASGSYFIFLIGVVGLILQQDSCLYLGVYFLILRVVCYFYPYLGFLQLQGSAALAFIADVGFPVDTFIIGTKTLLILAK